MTVRSRPARVLTYAAVLCLALLISSSLETATAQDVHLKLQKEIDESGGSADKDQPLDIETDVIVFRESGKERHTLEEAGYIERSDLVEAIRDASPSHHQVQEQGKVDTTFSRTESSGKIYYVLARTPKGNLFESYVNTVSRRHQPGFDPVETGNMSMGPVREQDTSTMRKLFEDSPDSSSQKKNEGRAQDGAPIKNAESAADTGGGFMDIFWSASLEFFAFLFGGGMGAAATFFVLSDQIESAKKKEKYYQKQYKELKDKQDVESRAPKRKDAGPSAMHKPKNEQRIEELEGKLDNKEKEIARLTSQLNERKQPAGPQSTEEHQGAKQNRTSSPSFLQPQPPSPKKESRLDSSSREQERIGELFCTWCHQRGNSPMVDRHNLFVNGLSKEFPSATSRRIFRENNAAGLVFSERAQDPVEYWLVEYNGQSLLLPQPSKNGFRELGECFEGKNVAPKDVREVRPAQLKSGSRGLTLEKKGRVV